MSKSSGVGISDVLGGHCANPSTPAIGEYVVHAFGMDWSVSGEEQRIKGQFEKHMRAQGKRAIQLLESDGEQPDALREYRAAYVADVAAGAYSWDGTACRRARSDIPGLRYLFYLMLRRCHPEVDLGTATKIFKTFPEDVSIAMGQVQGNWEPPMEGANREKMTAKMKTEPEPESMDSP